MQNLDESNFKTKDISDIIIEAIPEKYAYTTFERSFPDLLDGIKLSVRRILFSMIVKNCHRYNGATLKSAGVIGETMQIHAHGDASLYGTLVMLAQPFSMNYPLIDGSGNFGTHSGDSYAAMRYTECKASEFAEEVIFKDYDPKITDMRVSEIPTRMEPVWFSTRVPLVLIEGANGVAEAFTCSIPPHNLTDIVERCIKYIKNPNISNEELVDNLFPDYPCGGVITNGEEVQRIYKYNEPGTIKLRGKINIDTDNNIITIEEFPYGTNYKKIKTELVNLGEKNNFLLNKVDTIIDKTNKNYPFLKEGKIYCHKDANLLGIASIVKNKTSLKNFQTVYFRVFHNGKSKSVTVKDIISYWYEQRSLYIRKSLSYKKSNIEVDTHILEGIYKVYDHIDEIIQEMKKAKDKDDAIEKIMNLLPDLSKVQAKGISEIQLYKLSRLSKEDIYKNIESNRNMLKVLDEEMNRIPEIIITQLISIDKKFGRPRRTKVIMNEIEEKRDIDISNKVLLYARNSYLISEIDNFINSKNITNGLLTFKLNNKNTKEIIGFDFIKENCQGLVLFYSNGISNYISKEKISDLNHWLFFNDITNEVYISHIIPVYDDNDYLFILSDSKKLRKVLVSEFKNKSQCGKISNVIYLENSFDGGVFIVDSDANYVLLHESKDNSEVPLTNKKAQGVLTQFDENKQTFMLKINPDTKYINVNYSDEHQGYIYIHSESDFIVSSRNNKLKNLKSKNVDENLKVTGINIVDLPNRNKDYITILISNNNSIKYNSRNLKTNEYKKIAFKPFGLIQF